MNDITDQMKAEALASIPSSPATSPRKPARKWKTRKRAAVPPPPKAVDEFPGMDYRLCSTACTSERCVISGENVCTHPDLGGLHAKHMAKADVINRFQRAKNYLIRKRLKEKL